jgi:hypothetical protein
MWLRVRCVRELANQASPLDEIAPVSPTAEAAGITTAQAYRDLTLTLNGNVSNGSDLLRRLEALQQPSLHTVLRSLLGWNKQNQTTQQLSLVQSVIFTPQIQAPNGQSNVLSTTLSGDVTLTQASVSVNTGQTIGQLIFWDSQAMRVYSVSDSRGERLTIVVHTVPATVDDAENPNEFSAKEVLIIDSAGQILDRSIIRDGDLIGKLSEPLGQAEQVVFGATGWVANQNGVLHTTAVGHVSVRIIERGQWKTVQTIEAPASAETGNQTEPSSMEESP